MTTDNLKDAELLVRTLILISRNFDNISSVAAADYVHLIITITSSIMSKVSSLFFFLFFIFFHVFI